VTDACDCITCGDVAVLARVVELRGANALIEHGGARDEVAIELVEPVLVGEQLLCHAGVAIGRPQEQLA
jgi:hydrogenase maturation factor